MPSSNSPQGLLFPHRDGFHQLPSSKGSMNSTQRDHLEDIPLEKVVTAGSITGARKPSFTAASSTAFDPANPGNQRPHLGRRKTNNGALGQRKKGGGDDDTGALTRMGRIYQRIIHFSVITRYFIYVLPIALVLSIPIFLGIFLFPNATVQGVKLYWFFAWIEVVWLSLWVAKIFAHFIPVFFQFFAGVVSPGVRKYYLVLKALEMPLSFVGWTLASLLSFSPIMLDNPDTKEKAKTRPELNSLQPGFQVVMHELLGAFLVCSLIFLAERFLVQLISISYHRAQFDEKIKENKRSVHLLSILYDASRALFPEYCKEFEEEDYIINDSMNLSALNGMNKAGGAANPMRLIQNVGHGVGRIGDKVGAAFGAVAQEVTGKKVFDLDSGHSIVVEALEKTRSSEALAKRLWLSFVVEGNDALYSQDFIEVLGADRREEADEAFAAIDKDGNGDISLEEMILTVTEIGRTRKSLASSMHDVDQAIHVLDNLLITVVFIVSIFVIVAFTSKSFLTSLTTTGTALLSLSFVFAATCQEVLGSCIFLFVKHPFDISDRVDISGEQLVVERISLLFTVFKRVATGKVVQIPNIVLNGLWIDNITRSKAMREQLSVYVNFDTTFDDIQTLKAELHKFVTDKENSRDFQSELDIEIVSIAEMNKMELKVEIKHKSNWSNETVRAARRSKFMCALVMALRRVPIYGPGGGNAVQGSADAPSYSVSISPDDAQRNKDKFAAGKEAKRLIPSKPKAPEKSATSGYATGVDTAGGAEYQAVQVLNARNAAVDPMRDDTWQVRDDVSTLDDRPNTTDHDANSERGLLRDGSRGGRRGPHQTTHISEESPFPPRGPSLVNYAQPPGSQNVPNPSASNGNAAPYNWRPGN